MVASSVGSAVITRGIFSDDHPLGVLLKDRLPNRGLAKAMNLGSVISSSSKSGTLNLTTFDAFKTPKWGGNPVKAPVVRQVHLAFWDEKFRVQSL